MCENHVWNFQFHVIERKMIFLSSWLYYSNGYCDEFRVFMTLFFLCLEYFEYYAISFIFQFKSYCRRYCALLWQPILVYLKLLLFAISSFYCPMYFFAWVQNPNKDFDRIYIDSGVALLPVISILPLNNPSIK